MARIMIFRQALVPQIRAFLNVALPKVGVETSRGGYLFAKQSTHKGGFRKEIHLDI